MDPITVCRACENNGLKPFFDLGNQPLANSLLERPDEHEDVYPLSLRWCPSCQVVQLNHTVDPTKLFSNYVWVTGTSQTAREYAMRFYEELVRRAGNSKVGYVLEVASNDGTFLRPFLRNGFEVLGIDPARNVAEMAEKSGIPTETAFFGTPYASELLARRGPAGMVFARNVLPHVANTTDFVEALAQCLRKDGTLAIEVHYAKIILEELHYDSIYHEHLCYFTLKSLENLLNRFGLYVFDVMKSPISGGSIVVYARRARGAEEPLVQEYRARELTNRTNKFASWERFAEGSFAHREKLRAMLGDQGKQGKRIVGWGASARSSTMLNFCGITSALLPVISDMNPLKQKRYTAGTHIFIDDPEVIMKRKPDVVVILAWNFEREIRDILKEQFNYQGDCLVPLPFSPRLMKN